MSKNPFAIKYRAHTDNPGNVKMKENMMIRHVI
jgi:hypothetical protein